MLDTFILNLNLNSKGIWWVFLFGSIVFLIVLLMPKRLKKREIYFIFGVVGYVTMIMDVSIMSTYFDLFDLGSEPDVEGIGDLISMAIIPSCLAVIFSNYFKWKKKWIYVGAFVLISFMFEWILVQVGYMKLKGWKTWWSLPVYFVVYSYWLPWQLEMLRVANVNEKIVTSKKINFKNLLRIREKAK